jgi:hypothetical protein
MTGPGVCCSFAAEIAFPRRETRMVQGAEPVFAVLFL